MQLGVVVVNCRREMKVEVYFRSEHTCQPLMTEMVLLRFTGTELLPNHHSGIQDTSSI
jgi:hypothetical protein